MTSAVRDQEKKSFTRRREDAKRSCLPHSGLLLPRCTQSGRGKITGPDGPNPLPVSYTHLELPTGDPAVVRAAFVDAFRARFGYAPHDDLVVDRIRVELTEAGDAPAALPAPAPEAEVEAETVTAWLAGGPCAVPLHPRSPLAPDRRIAGPAIIVDPLSTTVVEPGWTATVEPEGTLRLAKPSATRPVASPSQGGGDDPAAPDPVRLEIFNSLFMAIAEEMGGALQHSASSINIRERLDFSLSLIHI